MARHALSDTDSGVASAGSDLPGPGRRGPRGDHQLARRPLPLPARLQRVVPGHPAQSPRHVPAGQPPPRAARLDPHRQRARLHRPLQRRAERHHLGIGTAHHGREILALADITSVNVIELRAARSCTSTTSIPPAPTGATNSKARADGPGFPSPKTPLRCHPGRDSRHGGAKGFRTHLTFCAPCMALVVGTVGRKSSHQRKRLSGSG